MNTLQDVANALKQAERIALFTHTNPDGDALGSSFAMKAVLETLGKQVTVFLEKEIPEKYAYLNMGYELCGDSSDFDLALALDCGALNRLGDLVPLYEAMPLRAVVDHHYADCGFGDIYLTDPHRGACAELVYLLAKSLHGCVPAAALAPLYTGISTDTGHFKFSNVTPETFQIAAELLSLGLDHRDITRRLYDTVRLDKLKFTGALADRVGLYNDGKIAVLSCFDSFLRQFNLTFDEVEELPNTVLSIQGVEVSVIIKEREQGGLKISLRCKENIDLSVLASEFGGGGHKCAAGFVTELSEQEIEAKLVHTIQKRLEELT